jgi:hypothetical protein
VTLTLACWNEGYDDAKKVETGLDAPHSLQTR